MAPVKIDWVLDGENSKGHDRGTLRMSKAYGKLDKRRTADNAQSNNRRGNLSFACCDGRLLTSNARSQRGGRVILRGIVAATGIRHRYRNALAITGATG